MSFGPYPAPISRQAKQPIGIDWDDWLESGETLDENSVAVSWEDEDGNDASTLQSGSPSVSNTTTLVTKGENSGTPGKSYFVIFTVQTSEGRTLGGDRVGTIKLRITKNF